MDTNYWLKSGKTLCDLLDRYRPSPSVYEHVRAWHAWVAWVRRGVSWPLVLIEAQLGAHSMPRGASEESRTRFLQHEEVGRRAASPVTAKRTTQAFPYSPGPRNLIHERGGSASQQRQRQTDPSMSLCRCPSSSSSPHPAGPSSSILSPSLELREFPPCLRQNGSASPGDWLPVTFPVLKCHLAPSVSGWFSVRRQPLSQEGFCCQLLS